MGVSSDSCLNVDDGATCSVPGGDLFDPFRPPASPVPCSELPGCCGGTGTVCQAAIQYLDGTGAQGPVFKAPVVIGNISVDVFVAAITREKGGFSSEYFHGILGLGVIPNSGIPDFLSMLEGQNVPPIVSMCLGETGGDIVFGVPDLTKALDPLQYARVTAPYQEWGIVMDSLVVSGAAPISTPGLRVVVDSGTTLMVVPNSVLVSLVAALKAQCTKIPGLSGFFCDPTGNIFIVPDGKCMRFSLSILSILPDIEVHIPTESGNSTIIVRIPGRNYIRYEERDGSACGMFGVVSMAQAPPELVLLGDVFLRSTFASFDRSTRPPRIGFARPVNCTIPPQTAGGVQDPLIIGGVILVALFIGGAVFLVWFLIERRKRSSGPASAAASVGGGNVLGGSQLDVSQRKLPAFDDVETTDLLDNDEF